MTHRKGCVWFSNGKAWFSYAAVCGGKVSYRSVRSGRVKVKFSRVMLGQSQASQREVMAMLLDAKPGSGKAEPVKVKAQCGGDKSSQGLVEPSKGKAQSSTLCWGKGRYASVLHRQCQVVPRGAEAKSGRGS